jgi:hypothetical protein
VVPKQPGQKKFARPYLNGEKLGVVVCTCDPSKPGKPKKSGIFAQVGLTKK